MPRKARSPFIDEKSDGTFWVSYATKSATGKRYRAEEKVDAETYEQAQEYLTLWLAQRGKAADRDADPLIGTLLDLYHMEHSHECSDPKAQEDDVNYLHKHFGSYRMSEFHAAVDTYKRDLSRKDSTQRTTLLMLNACLNHNIGRGRLDMIPQYNMPPRGKPRKYWLTQEEVDVILYEQLPNYRKSEGYPTKNPEDHPLWRLEIFCWLAFHCGQRLYVTYKLEWDRVNFKTGEIDFRIPGKKMTKKRTGIVYMSNELEEFLRIAHEQRTGRFVIQGGGDPSNSVRKFRARKEVNLPKLTAHTFRHTKATHMALNPKLSIQDIANVLHDDLATVSRNYAHYRPEEAKKAAEHRREPLTLRLVPSVPKPEQQSKKRLALV